MDQSLHDLRFERVTPGVAGYRVKRLAFIGLIPLFSHFSIPSIQVYQFPPHPPGSRVGHGLQARLVLRYSRTQSLKALVSVAWPFLVGGVICLLNCDNERDLNLLNSQVSFGWPPAS